MSIETESGFVVAGRAGVGVWVSSGYDEKFLLVH